MSQIIERFAAATRSLVGDGPVKDRLNQAYCEYLEDLQQVELPIPGKAGFRQLHAALHSASPIGKIDGVRASIRKMSLREAEGHARIIVELYAELLRHEREARPQPEIIPQQTELPPGYLVGRGR